MPIPRSTTWMTQLERPSGRARRRPRRGRPRARRAARTSRRCRRGCGTPARGGGGRRTTARPSGASTTTVTPRASAADWRSRTTDVRSGFIEIRSGWSVTAPDSICERSVRSETSASISEDWRSRMPRRRARSLGSSSSPASVSTAARMAAIGVRELVRDVRHEPAPHRLRVLALRDVADDADRRGLAGGAAVRDGADRDLEDLLGRELAPEAEDRRRRRGLRRAVRDPGLEEAEGVRVPDEVDESGARGSGGDVEEGERGRVRVEEREGAVHDEEADGDLLEDGPREEARLLAALALGRDEAREPGEREEDFLRLLRSAGGRLGVAAGGRLRHARADALEVARVALPDERDDDGHHEAGEEGDLQERPPERLLEGVEVVLADREADVPDGRLRVADPPGDVDERREDRRGLAGAEPDEMLARREDLGPRRRGSRRARCGPEGPRCRAITVPSALDEREARAGLAGRETDALGRGRARPRGRPRTRARGARA